MLKPHSDNFDVIIAGGGPAGASAAIHLARGGVRVLLTEQKKFPRAKLCGEFISPECRAHFERLGVASEMIASGPALLDETVFYSSKGHHVAVPSKWFGGRAAFGLSRAVMDEVLLRSAAANGAVVYEGASITEPLLDGERVVGVRAKIDGSSRDFRAPITLDATGRARILSRKISSGNSKRPSLVAFKAHFERLGVASEMIASGPALLDETVFYSSKGHHVAVPSTWFGGRAAFGGDVMSAISVSQTQ